MPRKLSHLRNQFVWLGHSNINSDVWGESGGLGCSISRQGVMMGLSSWRGLSCKGAHKSVWSHGFTPYNGFHHASTETRQTWKQLLWSRFPACGEWSYVFVRILFTHSFDVSVTCCWLHQDLGVTGVMGITCLCDAVCLGALSTIAMWYGHCQPHCREVGRVPLFLFSSHPPLSLSLSYKSLGALSEFNLYFVICGPTSAFTYSLTP